MRKYKFLHKDRYDLAVLIPIQAITNTPESLLSVRYILWHFPRENENFASSMSAIKV